MSNHFGTMNSGHYTAYVKNGSRWYEMNDSNVRPLNDERVIGRGAYMLFY